MPRGEGTFRLVGDKVRFEKVHTYPDGFKKIRLSVTMPTVQECLDVMQQKEITGFQVLSKVWPLERGLY